MYRPLARDARHSTASGVAGPGRARRMAVAGASVVLALTMTAACSSGGDGAPAQETSAAGPVGKGVGGDGTSGQSPEAPKGPQYKGSAIPGLADRPAWSESADQAGVCAGRADIVVGLQGSPDPACAFGDAVVFVRSVDPNKISEGFTATIRDGATGAERVTVEAKPSAQDLGVNPERFVKVGYWKDGSPALVVRSVAQTDADGLKAETTRTTLTMYAPSGKVLGSSEFTGDVHKDPIVWDGYLVPSDGPYVPIGGGAEFKPPAGMRYEHTWPTENFRREPLKYFLHNTTDCSEPGWCPSKLVVRDMFTDKELWGSRSIPLPEPIRAAAASKPPSVSVVAARDKLLLLAWTTASGGPTTFTAHDPATGGLISQGPTTPPGVKLAGATKSGVAVSPDGGIAVAALSKGAVAWETASGKKLWEQAADERQLRPLAVSPKGVLYADLDGGGTAALDARTYTLLAEKVPSVPSFGDTFGVVREENSGDYFVFPVAPPK